MNNYDRFKRGIEENKVPENKARKAVVARRKKIVKIDLAILLAVSLIIFIGLFDVFGKAFANAFYGAFGCFAIAGCMIAIVVSILKLAGVKHKKLKAKTIFYMVVLCVFIVMFMQILSTVNAYKALENPTFKAYLDACFLHGRNNAGGALFGVFSYPFLSVMGSVTSLCVIAVLFFGTILLCFRSFFYVEKKQTIVSEDSDGGSMYIETIDGAKKSKVTDEFSILHPNNLSPDDEYTEENNEPEEAEIQYGSITEKLLDEYMSGETKPEDRKRTAEELLFMSDEQWQTAFKKKTEEEEVPNPAIKTGERTPFQTGFSTETAEGKSIDTIPETTEKHTIESAYNIYKEGGLTAEELLFGNIIETPDLTYDELYPKKKVVNDDDVLSELIFESNKNAESVVKNSEFDAFSSLNNDISALFNTNSNNANAEGNNTFNQADNANIYNKVNSAKNNNQSNNNYNNYNQNENGVANQYVNNNAPQGGNNGFGVNNVNANQYQWQQNYNNSVNPNNLPPYNFYQQPVNNQQPIQNQNYQQPIYNQPPVQNNNYQQPNNNYQDFVPNGNYQQNFLGNNNGQPVGSVNNAQPVVNYNNEQTQNNTAYQQPVFNSNIQAPTQNNNSFVSSTPIPEVTDLSNAIYDESLDIDNESEEENGEKDYIVRSRIERPEDDDATPYIPPENPFKTVYRPVEEPVNTSEEAEITQEREIVEAQQPQQNQQVQQDTKPKKQQLEVKKEKPKPEKKVARPYKAPSLGLLGEPDPPHCNMDFAGFYQTIEDAFKTYEMPVRVIAHTRGPTFTLYAVQLGSGVYFKRVMSREEDINRKLCCDEPISIVPTVKDMDAIGIEVFYRETRSVVPLKRYLVSEKYKKDKKLYFPIGVDVYGDAYYCDIFGAPHMLIGGTTGSGKSICINTIICTILYNYSPEYVKLILIDPKTVELAAFATIPHSLLGRTINNTADSVKALGWAVAEMQRRYEIMADSQMKNIASYNDLMKEKGEPTLPYIVIIIDELADLMLSDKKNAPDLEKNINLLTAKSRACGIHLILATQRPSKEIVTGLIKNNVATRIAFTMGDAVASKVILDRGGAEKLYGRGDLLFSSPDYSKPVRLQAPFVSEKEVNEITDTVKANNDLIVDEEIVNAIFNDKPTPAEMMIDNASDDTPKISSSEQREKNFEEILKDVIAFAARQGVISISKIQRQFNIGFLKAGNIVDRMEEMGIIGPATPGSSKPRDVLITMADLPKYIGDDNGN